MPTTLFILYNSENRLFDGVIDSVVKMVKPAAQQCKLHGLTHGYFGRKDVWSQFLLELGERNMNVRMLYRDDLQQWPLHFKQIPGIYKLSKGKLELLLGTSEINEIEKCRELIDVVRKTLLSPNNSEGKKEVSRTH